jgi:hypothetical protein
MSQKTIQIDPTLLSISGRSSKSGTKKREKKKKPKAATLVKPDRMKKQWIQRVKEYQMRKQSEAEASRKEEEKKVEEQSLQDFNDEFSKSLSDMRALADARRVEKREKRSKKRRDRQQRAHVSPSIATNSVPGVNVLLDLPPDLAPTSPRQPLSSKPVAVSTRPAPALLATGPLTPALTPALLTPALLTPALLTPAPPPAPAPSPPIQSFENRFPRPATKPAPPYSTLRNGTRPTYREWKRGQTMKNRDGSGVQFGGESIVKDTGMSEREKRLQTAKETLSKLHNTSGGKQRRKKNKSKTPRMIKKRRTTKTIKHRVGKRNGTISVLVKNNDTRKLVQSEKVKLQRTSIVDIKKYLRARNLIKAGSNAPNDVLRKMYEQCMLSGDLTNQSSDVLIHNFMAN